MSLPHATPKNIVAAAGAATLVAVFVWVTNGTTGQQYAGQLIGTRCGPETFVWKGLKLEIGSCGGTCGERQVCSLSTGPNSEGNKFCYCGSTPPAPDEDLGNEVNVGIPDAFPGCNMNKESPTCGGNCPPQMECVIGTENLSSDNPKPQPFCTCLSTKPLPQPDPRQQPGYIGDPSNAGSMASGMFPGCKFTSNAPQQFPQCGGTCPENMECVVRQFAPSHSLINDYNMTFCTCVQKGLVPDPPPPPDDDGLDPPVGIEPDPPQDTFPTTPPPPPPPATYCCTGDKGFCTTGNNCNPGSKRYADSATCLRECEKIAPPSSAAVKCSQITASCTSPYYKEPATPACSEGETLKDSGCKLPCTCSDTPAGPEVACQHTKQCVSDF